MPTVEEGIQSQQHNIEKAWPDHRWARTHNRPVHAPRSSFNHRRGRLRARNVAARSLPSCRL